VPISDNPILGYRIQASSDDGETFVEIESNYKKSLGKYYHKSLFKSQQYKYKISAVNAVGESVAGEALNIAGDVPDTPERSTVVAQKGRQMVVTIPIPEDNGYSNSKYKIQRSIDNFATWTDVPESSSNTITDVDLVIGQHYKYRAFAQNHLGWSLESLFTFETLAGDVPSKPVSPVMVVGTS